MGYPGTVCGLGCECNNTYNNDLCYLYGQHNNLSPMVNIHKKFNWFTLIKDNNIKYIMMLLKYIFILTMLSQLMAITIKAILKMPQVNYKNF